METILFFRNKAELRKWLKKNHKKEKELWVGIYKKPSGRESIDWPGVVETVLCFGWIDGIRKSIDDISYKNRITPRNPKSNWSSINIRKVEELKGLGLMEPAGLEVYEKRIPEKCEQYSFEKEKVELSKEYRKIFSRNKKAWNFFNQQVPSYKKPAINWVISAKKEETRLKRLFILIQNSEDGLKIPPLRRE